MRAFGLKRAASVEDAVAALESTDGKVIVKAGGTDVLVWIKKRAVCPDWIVDISAVEALRGVCRLENEIRIGAMASVNEVARNPDVVKFFPALRDACLSHSDQIVRNKATVVGNLCAAVPSGDVIPALMVHEFRVHITGPGGARAVTAPEFIKGPRKTCLERGEIVTHISAPAVENRGCYIKLGRRNALDLAQVGVACVRVGAIYRIACGAVAPAVYRALAAEDILRGAKCPDSAMLEAAAEAAMAQAKPITDVRATSQYRTHQVGELVKRAVMACSSEEV